MKSEITKTVKVAEKLARKAINSEFKKIDNIDLPTTSGVYIIKHRKNGIIYIGKAKNLRRRIGTDHLSAETSDTMSSFRRSVHKKYGLPFGLKMKKWILDNCSFSYLEIPNHDMYSLVEAMLIASFRSNNLLNKS